MDIKLIAGYAVITKTPEESAKLYRDDLGLPLQEKEQYLSMDKFTGSKHFGIWPLDMAAKSCFGAKRWPENIPQPTSTIEYELDSPSAVAEAVSEMEEKGYTFIHGAREEPWGQTVARLLSPENILIGFSFSPWFHE
ncbi:MAG: hypothetical protein QF552_05405 [Litorilituus sp.]|jgi:catechol 2,3-dioxygenase-like lactoylglutathione lyase family enzyme|nr:hypothetical protein [Litorilituus sp.]